MTGFLKRRYGSKRGFVRTWMHRIKAMFGAYDDIDVSDWQSFERVIFVCKGNICRSAFAEKVYRDMGYPCDSCGIDTIVDAPANGDALRIAAQMGVDLGDHLTTRLQDMSLSQSDLLVAMEPAQVEFIKHAGITVTVTLLGLRGTPRLPLIADPYGCDDEYFSRCLRYIRDTLDATAQQE